MPQRTRRKLILFWSVLAAIPVLIPFCGAELTLRLKDPRGRAQLMMAFGLPVQSNYIDDPNLGYKPRDDLYFWDDKANPPSQKKPENTIRIFAMGDSFVKAHGNIGKENSFYHVAARQLSQKYDKRLFQWFHFGVSGYCERQHLELLRQYGPKFSPDIVLVQAYLGNDVGENANIIMQQLEYRGREVKINNSYRAPGSQPDAAHGAVADCMEKVLNHSYLARFLDEKLAVIRWKIKGIPQQPATSFDVMNLHTFELMSRKTPQHIEAAWQTTDDIIRRLKAQADQLNTHLAFVLIPKEMQVSKKVADETAAGFHMNPADYDFDLPNRRFGRILNKYGIPYLDLTPIFREAIESGVDLYDGHFNKEGHRLTGEKITELLSGTGWLN